jgi:hypothetical protein
MDDKPVPLMQETRPPGPAQPGTPQRYDYEYARGGTANVLLGPKPLPGGRTIAISPQRTAIAWAHQINHLLDDCYPDADTGILVGDHLTPHKSAAL